MARVGYTVECQRAKYKHWHPIGTHKETDIQEYILLIQRLQLIMLMLLLKNLKRNSYAT